MYQHHFANLSEVKMHYLEGGSGAETVMLLHGWPHTSYTWRNLIPKLGEEHRVLAPDLRGLGDSSRGASRYDIEAVATDLVELIDLLGIKTLSVVGHDWGGPVAFALALLAPQRVIRLAIVDVVLPGDGRAAGSSQGGQRWHHAFHRTPDLPEILTAGREAAYLQWFYDEYSERSGHMAESDLLEYVRTYSQPGAMKCGFEYYRALERSNAFAAEKIRSNGTLDIPVMTIAGGAGRGRGTEVAESVGCVAKRVTSHIIEGCGHLVPEEAPDELFNLLRPFLSGN